MLKDSLVDIIFIFCLKWLHLRQFAYGDYEYEIAFFLSRQDLIQNLQFKIFTLTLVVPVTACFKKHPVLLLSWLERRASDRKVQLDSGS